MVRSMVLLTSLLFAETAILSDVVSEVSSRHQIDHEVKSITVFKSVVHVDQESAGTGRLGFMESDLRVVQLAKEFFLIHD